MDLSRILGQINDLFTLYLIFPAMLLLGLYLSFKLRFIQFTRLKESFKQLLTKRESGNGISHYQAVAAVLAGNFGTGNIAGMAIALATGGPGALVWMWVIAFLGATVQFASCVLGVKYREKNSKGEPVGGPMYYLSRGLGKRKLATLFALFALFAGLTAGNLTQVNSIALPLAKLGISPLFSGVGIAILVGIVLLGGIQRFAKVAASVVPIMAALYFGTALVILGLHTDLILPAMKQIFVAAFSPTSFAGGVMGFGLMRAVSTGFDRGIFATDAGTGIAPILQSSTESDDPITNGLVTLVAPVLVMAVCMTTGLVLLVTGAWQSGLQSTNMVTAAFSQGLGTPMGGGIVILALFLFSYTTILAWANCGERAVGYLLGEEWIQRYRWFFIAIVPVGAFCNVHLVWLLADISFSLMLLTNMIGVAGLSKEVIRDSNAVLFPKKIPG
ncbi:MAG: Amino-acid carrier protein AlsT [Chlamydiae bacterium]|nr:Amino-acid carrier protein AlsT [Chlamydiota bacterium]